MQKCQRCKKVAGVRVRCKLCGEMICNGCWSREHNSEYCAQCQGEYN